MTTEWSELVSAALIGTERRPVAAELTARVAALLGAELPTGPPELAVLTAAGVLGTYRRAGWSPPRVADPAPAPAPPDDRPISTPAATQLLELLVNGQVSLQGRSVELVAVWLERCVAVGRRPPDRLHPALLAAATTDQQLRRSVLAAGGPRLRWLTTRNPSWSWAIDVALPGAAPDIEAAWTTGDREARLRLFADLRVTDPDRARRLAADAWSSESARDRAVIVAGMAAGLTAADEAFLEAALDDRGKSVREAAAGLLTRLPSSRLGARMAERLRPLVSMGGRLRKKLEVAFPDELDAAARRDGIVDDGAPPKVGPKAWWVQQMIAATPLSFWDDRGDPDTIARLAEGVVRDGLALAALRQHDLRWAAALLRQAPDPTLLSMVDAADAAAALSAYLPTTPDAKVAALLIAACGPWSPTVSAIALARLRAAKTTGPLQHALPVLSTRLDPSVAGDVERWAADLTDDDHARRFVRGLVHALSIRQSIAQELT